MMDSALSQYSLDSEMALPVVSERLKPTEIMSKFEESMRNILPCSETSEDLVQVSWSLSSADRNLITEDRGFFSRSTSLQYIATATEGPLWWLAEWEMTLTLTLRTDDQAWLAHVLLRNRNTAPVQKAHQNAIREVRFGVLTFTRSVTSHSTDKVWTVLPSYNEDLPSCLDTSLCLSKVYTGTIDWPVSSAKSFASITVGAGAGLKVSLALTVRTGKATESLKLTLDSLVERYLTPTRSEMVQMENCADDMSFSLHDDDHCISITVANQRTFRIEKEILMKASPVLQACFSHPGLKENQAKVYDMSTWNEEVIEQFLVYCCYGSAPKMAEYAEELTEMADHFQMDELMAECELHMTQMALRCAKNDLFELRLLFQAVLEPNGVLRDDSKKRPDGRSLVPWKEGKALVWDVACVDSLCQTYRRGSSDQVGCSPNKAEEDKRTKYRRLEGSYHFCPLGFKTFGTFGLAAFILLREVGKNWLTERGKEKIL